MEWNVSGDDERRSSPSPQLYCIRGAKRPYVWYVYLKIIEIRTRYNDVGVEGIKVFTREIRTAKE